MRLSEKKIDTTISTSHASALREVDKAFHMSILRPSSTAPLLVLLWAICLIPISGCAHYPVNPPITEVDSDRGYRFITRPKDYRGSIAKRPIEAIQPIFRVTWADPNTDIARDDNWGLTPGIQIFFYGRNKLALNYDIALCADDTASASSFKMLLAGYF